MYTHPAPLAETVQRLRTGQHSLSIYLEQMCTRIHEVDEHVEAFLPEPDRLGRLQAQARALRARYATPDVRPALYGALVGVKDIFHVDGFVTRAGATVPPEAFAGAEAASVQRLRAAGALVAGKTVTTEFAYFEPGPTRNPHNLLHTPGGSSSGSAAAVAAGLCPLALGTQTIGSVIRPAAFCGIVGFKPSYDRIPTAGLVYFSPTVDHVGLFTQDLAGMALAASVLCDGWSPAGAPALPVLGVPVGSYLEQTELAARGAFEHQIELLESAGYRVVRIPIFADIDDLNDLHRRLAFGEFAREHAAIYPQYAHLYRPRTAEIIGIGQGVDDDELARLRENPLRLRAHLHHAMDASGIDLWIAPAAPGPAPAGIHATGDPNMNLPWTHAGLPAITLPAGRSEMGLPLGLQVVGRFGADETLLAWSDGLTEALAAA